MGAIRQTLNLTCALALTGAGIYFCIQLFPAADHFYFNRMQIWLLAASATASMLGMFWLWEDFINPIIQRNTKAE
jgi:hypothetical protein